MTNMFESQFTALDGTPIRMAYSEEDDTLEIFFGENVKATGVELTDHILLRIDQRSKKAVSLTIFSFSVLTELTEYGPRNYPLVGLGDLPESLRESVVKILMMPPVNQFLDLSHFQASATERIPTAYVKPQHIALA